MIHEEAFVVGFITGCLYDATAPLSIHQLNRELGIE